MNNSIVLTMATCVLFMSQVAARSAVSYQARFSRDTSHQVSAQSPGADMVKRRGDFLKFSGFVKHDVFFDTRQTVNAREALVTLYPQNVLPDADNLDINARPAFNMLNIHSRLRCEIQGPLFLGARSSGLLEADFYGNENRNFSDLNGLRLFNAYLKLNWKTTEVLAGQDWHPLSIAGFFPGVVSFSAGAPFHPMSRNPQIRLTQSAGKLKLSAIFLSQRDFTSTGPEGPGSQYLRNSGIPNIHLQLQYAPDSCAFSGGLGLDYKKIVPELSTTNDKGEVFSTNSALPGGSLTAFMSVRTKPVSIKLQGVYAQNAYDQLMLGGYAESRVLDRRTASKAFTNLNTVSAWTDIQSNTGKINFGLFYGYTKNLGSTDRIDGEIYARGADIKSVYRIAPRLAYTTGAVGISLEGEFTVADYGVPNSNRKGRVADTHAVANIRSLLSVKYSF